jgi:hypothetical protein
MSVVEGGMGGIRRFGVTLQPGSVTEFEIQSVNAYDKLKLSGVLRFNNDANLVLPNPVIKIKALPGAEIKEGDWFDIITADTVYANNAEYSIQYPEIQNITWQKYTQLVLDNPRVYKISVIARGPSAVKNIAMNNVSVYPNPVVGNALFTCKDGLMKSVEIINLQGQIMKTVDVNASEINLNVGELNSGLYYARINTSRGQEIHKLIIK